MKEYKKRSGASSPGRAGSAFPADLFAGGMPSLTEGASRKELPEAMRAKMENAFGADFSHLNIYESEKVAEGGARAVTQGNTIAFAPGEFNVYSPSSEALLGHELSHVVSQARGESRGDGLLNDSYLEARADREGVLAAAGQQVYSGPVTPISDSSPMSVAGPMQCKGGGSNRRKPAGGNAAEQVSQGVRDARSNAIAQVNRNMKDARDPELMEIDPENEDELWQHQVNRQRGQQSYLNSTSLVSMEKISSRLLGELGRAGSKEEIQKKMELWGHYYAGRYNEIIVDENDVLRPQTNKEQREAEGEAIRRDRASYLENRKRVEEEEAVRRQEEERARREQTWKRMEEESELFEYNRRDQGHWEMTDEIVDLPQQSPKGKKKSRFGNLMRQRIEENNEYLEFSRKQKELQAQKEADPKGGAPDNFDDLMDWFSPKRHKPIKPGKPIKKGKSRLGLRNYVDEDFPD